MIIDSLRNYMRKCPHLDAFNNAIRVNVNYLELNVDTYSIEEIPIEPVIKKYVNGDSVRQYAFIFTLLVLVMLLLLQKIRHNFKYNLN